MRILVLAFFLFSCGPAAEIHGQLATPEVEAGAKGAGASNSMSEPPPPIIANLDDVKTKLFAPSCTTAGCHAPPSPALDLDLTLPTDMLSARLRADSKETLTHIPLVTPNQFGASYLYLKVFLSTPASGDQMPPTSPLDPALVNGLKAWIQAGAP